MKSNQHTQDQKQKPAPPVVVNDQLNTEVD